MLKFRYWDTKPYLGVGGERVEIPYEDIDGGYRPLSHYRDTTYLPEIWEEKTQTLLLTKGVDIEEPLGEVLEEYYLWLENDLQGLYEDWQGLGKEEFMENYQHYNNSNNWQKLWELWEKKTDMGLVVEEPYLERECLYIPIIIGEI